MEDFEKTVAQFKQQLLDIEHRRHQEVRVWFRRWAVTVCMPAMETLQGTAVSPLCDVSTYHFCFLSGSRDKVSTGKRWTADQLWEEGSVCTYCSFMKTDPPISIACVVALKSPGQSYSGQVEIKAQSHVFLFVFLTFRFYVWSRKIRAAINR